MGSIIVQLLKLDDRLLATHTSGEIVWCDLLTGSKLIKTGINK